MLGHMMWEQLLLESSLYKEVLASFSAETNPSPTKSQLRLLKTWRQPSFFKGFSRTLLLFSRQIIKLWTIMIPPLNILIGVKAPAFSRYSLNSQYHSRNLVGMFRARPTLTMSYPRSSILQMSFFASRRQKLVNHTSRNSNKNEADQNNNMACRRNRWWEQVDHHQYRLPIVRWLPAHHHAIHDLLGWNCQTAWPCIHRHTSRIAPLWRSIRTLTPSTPASRNDSNSQSTWRPGRRSEYIDLEHTPWCRTPLWRTLREGTWSPRKTKGTEGDDFSVWIIRIHRRRIISRRFHLPNINVIKNGKSISGHF